MPEAAVDPCQDRASRLAAFQAVLAAAGSPTVDRVDLALCLGHDMIYATPVRPPSGRGGRRSAGAGKPDEADPVRQLMSYDDESAGGFALNRDDVFCVPAAGHGLAGAEK